MELHATIFDNATRKFVDFGRFAPWLLVLAWSDEAVLITDILTCKVVILLILRTINNLLLIIFNLYITLIKMFHKNA